MHWGTFDFKAMAIEEHGENFNELEWDAKDAFSWKAVLNDGTKIGFNLLGWTQKTVGHNATVHCFSKNAMSWYWKVTVEELDRALRAADAAAAPVTTLPSPAAAACVRNSEVPDEEFAGSEEGASGSVEDGASGSDEEVVPPKKKTKRAMFAA